MEPKIAWKNFKEGMGDLLVYSSIVWILIIPFFNNNEVGGELKHLSAAILVGWLFGMLNRIVRELFLLKGK